MAGGGARQRGNLSDDQRGNRSDDLSDDQRSDQSSNLSGNKYIAKRYGEKINGFI